MANYYDKQIVEEGHRNAIVKITATLDTVNLDLPSLIKPSDFFNSDPRMTLTGFRFDSVQYALGPVLGLVMSWNGAIPQQIVSLSNSDEFDTEGFGYGGLQPDQTRDGYDGSINIKTTGFIPGTVQNMTAVISLTKLYR